MRKPLFLASLAASLLAPVFVVAEPVSTPCQAGQKIAEKRFV